MLRRRRDLETRIVKLEGYLEAARQMVRDESGRARELQAIANELVSQKHELEVKNAVLKERIDLMVNHMNAPTKAWGSPEEVEDAEYQLQHGLIDKGEYEEILSTIGFDNTEIEFASSDQPRLGR